MKTLLILGAGTAGTMVANKMSHHLDPRQWKIIIVDQDETHYYQPGFLFVPFGIYSPEDVIKPKKNFIPRNAEFVLSEVDRIDPTNNQVVLQKDGRVISYDYLVIATGSRIVPEETPGLRGNGWYENVFDFYTLEGATALGRRLHSWEGGTLLVNITEMPIKCPVAPLEFLFLADWHFRQKGIRDRVDIVFATPLSGAFTKPIASALLGEMLEERSIHLEADFNIERLDHDKGAIVSYDERQIPFDLLVTTPTNMGSKAIERSGMGDELNFVPTHKHTLQSKKWENIWVIGDAANVPTSKAGSVAHFMLDTLSENMLRHMKGKDPLPTFDGHANCFVETGFGKAILVDFNYEVEPLPGLYPFPVVGPFPLLRDSALNHWGKMAFRWVYWNLMLKSKPIPLPSPMSMAGKRKPAIA